MEPPFPPLPNPPQSTPGLVKKPSLKPLSPPRLMNNSYSLSRRKILISSSLALLLSPFAQTISAQEISDRVDRAPIQSSIDAITLYLNNIRTLKAEIIQRSSRNNNQLSGNISIKRPGFLHLEYNKPSPITLIADSRSLIIVDKNLKEVQSIPLSQTPAHFFLQRVIDLSPRKIAILDYSINENSLTFDVTSSEVENQNRLRISFLKKPFSLLGWTLVEPDNHTTEIFLKKLQINTPVDESLFAFKNPWK
jgi:outer membrane lipoprotein-sorting protein